MTSTNHAIREMASTSPHIVFVSCKRLVIKSWFIDSSLHGFLVWVLQSKLKNVLGNSFP